MTLFAYVLIELEAKEYEIPVGLSVGDFVGAVVGLVVGAFVGLVVGDSVVFV